MIKKIIYVRSSSPVGGDGTSWSTAFNSLQDALLSTDENSGTEIWVAEGTYYPTNDGDREKSFILKSGVFLYGGFKGSEKFLEERDWENNKTILSGNIGKDKDDILMNSFHVVVGADKAVLDGFIVEKGSALPERFDISKGAPPPPAEQGKESGRSGNQFEQTLVKVSPAALPGAPMRIIHDVEKVAGGGIYMVQGSPIVRNCIVRDNYAMKAGGIYMMSTTELPPENNNDHPYLENVTVINNRSFIRGGGVCCDMLTHPTYIHCRFINNYCDAKGGGVYNDFACNPTFVNCLFSGNHAERAAGCGNDGNSNSKYLYCTFTENKASDIGSALYNGTYGANMAGELGLDPKDETILYSNVPYLYKCLILNNRSEHSRSPYSNWHDSTMQIEDSIIETVDGESRDYSPDLQSKIKGYGYDKDRNIEGYQNVLALYNRIKTFAYPYHYSITAKGENDPEILYVKYDAGGDGSGLNWKNAYRSLSKALKFAKCGQSIWVARGKYLPTDDTNREASFVLKEGVRLYGGFSGNESYLEERDTKINETILSGDIGKGVKENNSYHVVIGASGTVIDGFTISDGCANGTALHQRGAGLLCYFGASPFMNNCIIKDNYAIEGAGIGCYKKTKPLILNTTFTNNSADRGAAALFRDGADARVIDCVFRYNNANDRGGAAYVDYGACPEFTLCTFEHNSADGNGGAVYVDDNASQVGDTSPVFTLTRFVNNSSQLKGGAIAACSFSTFVTVRDCELASNSAGTGGGAISLSFQVKLKEKSNQYRANTCKLDETADICSINGCTVENLEEKI